MAENHESENPTKIGLFEWLNDICHEKRNIMNTVPGAADQYEPFIIRRGLAQGLDTILLSEAMNSRHNLPKEMQYDFFFHAVTKKRRFNKWSKKTAVGEDVLLVANVYNVSVEKAEEYLRVISHQQLAELRSIAEFGGSKEKPRKTKKK